MKKIILILLITAFVAFGKNFDDFMDNVKITNPKGVSAYIHTKGKHKGELNFAKLVKNEKSMEAIFLSQDVTPAVLNDSVLLLHYNNNGTTKIIEYGSDSYYINDLDGKCKVTSWHPMNKFHHKKAKTMTCAKTGRIIETNNEGLPYKNIVNGYVNECLEHFTNMTKYCKTSIGYMQNNRANPDTTWQDSITGKIILTYTEGFYLRTVEFFENNLPKVYVNVNNPNQFWMVGDSTKAEVERIVDFYNGFKYVKILPKKDTDPILFVTNDSLRYNKNNIYILNDEMNIVDSLYNK